MFHNTTRLFLCIRGTPFRGLEHLVDSWIANFVEPNVGPSTSTSGGRPPSGVGDSAGDLLHTNSEVYVSMQFPMVKDVLRKMSNTGRIADLNVNKAYEDFRRQRKEGRWTDKEVLKWRGLELPKNVPNAGWSEKTEGSFGAGVGVHGENGGGSEEDGDSVSVDYAAPKSVGEKTDLRRRMLALGEDASARFRAAGATYAGFDIYTDPEPPDFLFKSASVDAEVARSWRTLKGYERCYDAALRIMEESKRGIISFHWIAFMRSDLLFPVSYSSPSLEKVGPRVFPRPLEPTDLYRGNRKLFELLREKESRGVPIEDWREFNGGGRTTKKVSRWFGLRIRDLDPHHTDVYLSYCANFPWNRYHGCPDDKFAVVPWRNAYFLFYLPVRFFEMAFRLRKSVLRFWEFIGGWPSFTLPFMVHDAPNAWMDPLQHENLRLDLRILGQLNYCDLSQTGMREKWYRVRRRGGEGAKAEGASWSEKSMSRSTSSSSEDSSTTSDEQSIGADKLDSDTADGRTEDNLVPKKINYKKQKQTLGDILRKATTEPRWVSSHSLAPDEEERVLRDAAAAKHGDDGGNPTPVPFRRESRRPGNIVQYAQAVACHYLRRVCLPMDQSVEQTAEIYAGYYLDEFGRELQDRNPWTRIRVAGPRTSGGPAARGLLEEVQPSGERAVVLPGPLESADPLLGERRGRDNTTERVEYLPGAVFADREAEFRRRKHRGLVFRGADVLANPNEMQKGENPKDRIRILDPAAVPGPGKDVRRWRLRNPIELWKLKKAYFLSWEGLLRTRRHSSHERHGPMHDRVQMVHPNMRDFDKQKFQKVSQYMDGQLEVDKNKILEDRFREAYSWQAATLVRIFLHRRGLLRRRRVLHRFNTTVGDFGLTSTERRFFAGTFDLDPKLTRDVCWTPGDEDERGAEAPAPVLITRLLPADIRELWRRFLGCGRKRDDGTSALLGGKMVVSAEDNVDHEKTNVVSPSTSSSTSDKPENHSASRTVTGDVISSSGEKKSSSALLQQQQEKSATFSEVEQPYGYPPLMHTYPRFGYLDLPFGLVRPISQFSQEDAENLTPAAKEVGVCFHLTDSVCGAKEHLACLAEVLPTEADGEQEQGGTTSPSLVPPHGSSASDVEEQEVKPVARRYLVKTEAALRTRIPHCRSDVDEVHCRRGSTGSTSKGWAEYAEDVF